MRVNNKVKLQQAEKEAARWKYLAEAKNREVQSLKGALDSVGEDARAKVKGSERFIIALMRRLGSSEVRISKEELAKVLATFTGEHALAKQILDAYNAMVADQAKK